MAERVLMSTVLRELRLKNFKTMEAFSDYTDIDVPTVSQMETSKEFIATNLQRKVCCLVLGVKSSDIFNSDGSSILQRLKSGEDTPSFPDVKVKDARRLLKEFDELKSSFGIFSNKLKLWLTTVADNQETPLWPSAKNPTRSRKKHRKTSPKTISDRIPPNEIFDAHVGPEGWMIFQELVRAMQKYGWDKSSTAHGHARKDKLLDIFLMKESGQPSMLRVRRRQIQESKVLHGNK